MKPHVRKPIAIAITCLAGAAAGTHAQDEAFLLDEIIVTAQKRQENLQQVPISISALSETAIERKGINNAQDLLSTMPNVGGFEAPSSRGTVSLIIRGVSGGNPTNLSIDPANAMYVDGVYMGKSIGNATDIADMERIEVLRGPQGTLYGRNAVGGAVNFITQKPSGELHTKLTATTGNYDLRGVRGSLDLPAMGAIGEGLGRWSTKLSYQDRERSGLYTNPNGDDFESINREAGRVALRWEPAESVVVDYAWDTSKLNEGGPAVFPTATNPSARNPATGELVDPLATLAAVAANRGVTENLLTGDYGANFTRFLDSVDSTLAQFGSLSNRAGSHAYGDDDAFSTNDIEGHALTAAWDVPELGALGDVVFKSITGVRHMRARNAGDLDGVDNRGLVSNFGLLSSLSGIYFGPLRGAAYSRADARTAADALWALADDAGGAKFYSADARASYEQLSQELQMTGTTERVKYVVGLYWFEDEGSFESLRQASVPLGGYNATAYDIDNDAWASYAQASWVPAVLDDRLELTFGLRYTEETKRMTYLYRQAQTNSIPYLSAPYIPASAMPAANYQQLIDYGFITPAGLVNGYDFTLEPAQAYSNGQVVSLYGRDAKKDFDNTSGVFNIAYQWSDDLNTYLKYSTGYRSGGFNGEVFNNAYDEETMSNIELGLKSEWWGQRLRVNAAVFQLAFEDAQVSQIGVDDAGRVTSKIVNAGEAKRWGAEIEITVIPTDDLMLSVNYGYLYGDFDEYAPACAQTAYMAAPACIDIDDIARRPNAPANNVAAIIDYTLARFEVGTLTAQLEGLWQDSFYPVASNYQGISYGTLSEPYDYGMQELDERTVFNARIGIDDIVAGAGSMRIALWGKNVFDQQYPTYGVNFGPLGLQTEQYGEPRTYGIDLTYQY